MVSRSSVLGCYIKAELVDGIKPTHPINESVLKISG